jgi:hypothetical protein
MAGTTITNERDTERKWPSGALADKVLLDDEGIVVEKIVGPGALATVALSRPASRIHAVLSYTTASRVWSTGGAPAKVPVPVQGTDFSVNLSNPAQGGKATLTELAGANYTTETWLVQYSPQSSEGTVSGSTVAR